MTLRPASPASDPDRLRRRLATATLIGVAIYILVDVVLQGLPPYYSPISEAESNLAVGPYGWVMDLNFLLRGVLTVCLVIALSRVGPPRLTRTIGLTLTAIGGVSSAVLAGFPTDVVRPGGPGEMSMLVATSAVGDIHIVLATIGFIAALSGFAVLTVWMGGSPLGIRRGDGRRPRTFTAAIVCVIVGFIGLLWIVQTSQPASLSQVAGLAERLALAGILGWVAVVCVGVLGLPRVSR
ncbi:DUF998 domain-containing protein [Glaciihabitans sp. dw_435]|uniref:DUF998 domain-containing protein n=1 Tax=Glaciihabitans sp. dw_435 TaxID=2720081 RepID=UPI001BD42009|nr:DUF998 domain-containing protein [Glaciihabitans sp. dw_435]